MKKSNRINKISSYFDSEEKCGVHAVLKTLLYFDVFNYPLTFNEILNHSKSKEKEVKAVIDKLVEIKMIYKLDGFYSLTNDLVKINRRKKGNIQANNVLRKAQKVSRFISKFPFVKAVFVSGSLSKGYFEEEDDIDFFIITSKGRLWLSKTILIAYKKIFLLNSKKYFCLNYFMSEDALEVKEKNMFTAVELSSLMPMIENGFYSRLRNENKWVLNYFPHYPMRNCKAIMENYRFKNGLEYLLNGRLGFFLNEKSMKLTKAFQKRKYDKLNATDFNIAFKSDEKVSKHHPDNHQTRTVDLLNVKIKAFNEKYSLSIPLE